MNMAAVSKKYVKVLLKMD